MSKCLEQYKRNLRDDYISPRRFSFALKGTNQNEQLADHKNRKCSPRVTVVTQRRFELRTLKRQMKVTVYQHETAVLTDK